MVTKRDLLLLLFAIVFLTKITAEHNEVELSYHNVRGLYFVAVIFGATIVIEIEVMFYN